MATYLYARAVHYDEFVQRVRRHSPSSLIPLVAKTGAQYSELNSWLNSPSIKLTPWALAEIARVSLSYGNEHRQTATDRDLLECAAAYSALADPDLPKHTPAAVEVFMLRSVSSQFAYQRHPRHELARTIAMLAQTRAPAMRVLTDGWDRELFGCTLFDYQAAAFLLHTAAITGAGRIDLERFLNDPGAQRITDVVAADTITHVLTNHFATDIASFRAVQERHHLRSLPRDLRRYAYNQLRSTPVIAGLTPDWLVPVPGEIMIKLSTLGIYYSGVRKWGNRFTEDFGRLFEQYVGRLLRSRTDHTVHGEITYGSDNRKSIDWIVVDDAAVVLIETKAVRPTEPVRLGMPCAAVELTRMLSRAFEQIDTTSELIAARHPAFAPIPDDRPRFGIVVTLEEFDAADVPGIRAQYEKPTGIPTFVASAYVIEQLVAVNAGIGSFLKRTAAAVQPGEGIATALRTADSSPNPVIAEGFRSFPWARPGD